MIQSGVCWSYKRELHEGVHDFREDVIKAALYTSNASLSPSLTTVYSSTNEATGTNWSAGGVVLPVSSGYPQLAGERSGVKFDDVEVEEVTVSFRAILIYNASKANRAILILDRGIDVNLTAGTLELFTNPISPYLLFNA